jgi:hypothetical protein
MVQKSTLICDLAAVVEVEVSAGLSKVLSN